MEGKYDAFSVQEQRNKVYLVYLEFKLHQHRFS